MLQEKVQNKRCMLAKEEKSKQFSTLLSHTEALALLSQAASHGGHKHTSKSSKKRVGISVKTLFLLNIKNLLWRSSVQV